MNKAELIEAITDRMGDKRTASTAVESIVDAITRSVAKGEKVAITGFGVFEKIDRAARTARNPATGAAVKLKKTSVPKFRPGQGFKDVVSGARKVAPLKKAAATAVRGTTGRPAKAAASTSAAPTKATRASAAKAPATKAAGRPAKASASKATSTGAAKAPAKASATKSAKAPAAKAQAAKATKATKAPAAPAAKAPAKKAPARKAAAR